MNCQEFRIRVDQILEKSCRQDVELQRHGESCSQLECRNAWEEFLLLEEAIEDWRRSENQCRQTWPASLPPDNFGGPFWSLRRIAAWRIPLGATACLLVAGWFFGYWPAGPLRTALTTERADSAVIAAEESPVRSAQVPATVFSYREEVFFVNDSAPVGLLVNWVAGTPLQVSGSMARLILKSPSQEADSSGWVPVWMEGWSEQIVPSRDDMELLRSLLDPQNRHSQLQYGHSDSRLA